MDEHQFFLENKFKKVAELISPNSTILDIGCNDGKLKNYLLNCKYFGVDINEEKICQLIKEKIIAKRVDLNKDNLPFKKMKFDYVLLLDILEHVLDPKKLLLESIERLEGGGKIIITLPNDYHLLNKIRFILNKPITEDSFAPYGHLHSFPIKIGERFLTDNGFKVLKKYSIAPTKPSFLPKSIKNLLGKIFPQSFARDILYLIQPT